MAKGDRYTPIAIEEMEELLKVQKGWVKDVSGNEIIFVFPLKNGLEIRVASSLRNSDEGCRDCGQDAIRIFVPKRMKSVRVYRTKNWRANLQARVMEAFNKYSRSH